MCVNGVLQLHLLLNQLPNAVLAVSEVSLLGGVGAFQLIALLCHPLKLLLGFQHRPSRTPHIIMLAQSLGGQVKTDLLYQ